MNGCWPRAALEGMIKLWDVESGVLLWTGWHTRIIENLTFAPDGQRLVSCGDNETIRLLGDNIRSECPDDRCPERRVRCGLEFR